MALSQVTGPAPPATGTFTPGASASASTISPDFTDPSFDPADFLNDVLPPLALASTQSQFPTSRGGGAAVNLAELSTRVQSILSQTNAQNIRHSTTLTQLTDEILRSGSRLAYEVEVLRGEAIGLSDTLTEGLRDEVAKFAPLRDTARTDADGEEGDDKEGEKEGGEEEKELYDPEFIVKLRTLNQVRAHLEDVVQAFGDAMEWPLPPSETSVTSSFISVSAPDTGPDSHSREEKGQEVAKKLRAEIAELLESGDDTSAGLQAAMSRVEALRVLATVWKGTAEEKARNRFVDGLMKMVDDRRRVLEDQGRSDLSQLSSQQGFSGRGPGASHRRRESEGPAGGIFKNLQRLREEIYLE